MTVNYYIKCIVCDTITRMRSVAGYVETTPVHIHCGNCNTLLTGSFVAKEETGQAYFVKNNCEITRSQEYQYYGEANGELLSRKICKLDGKNEQLHIPPFISQAMDAPRTVGIELSEEYVDYACHIYNLFQNWDKHRILYDLYVNQNYDLIIKKYSDYALLKGYNLVNEIDIHNYLHYTYYYDFGKIFGGSICTQKINKINWEFYHQDNQKLLLYISHLNKNNRLVQVQRDIFSIMNAYMKIAQFIMPAVLATLYPNQNDIDKDLMGISTCTFEDIKSFYIDSYETLVNHCDILMCLDNIKYRGGFEKFSNPKLSINEINTMSKGKRIKIINETEFFSSILGVEQDSNQLRNAIGHNDYIYSGITQLITYTPDLSRPQKTKQTFLIDIAMNCIELMRSSMLIEFIVYELLRISHRVDCESLPMHPIFFTYVKSGNHCPCGSKKKYSKCCKDWVRENKRIISEFKLPSKSNMRFEPSMLEEMLQKGLPHKKFIGEL